LKNQEGLKKREKVKREEERLFTSAGFDSFFISRNTQGHCCSFFLSLTHTVLYEGESEFSCGMEGGRKMPQLPKPVGKATLNGGSISAVPSPSKAIQINQPWKDLMNVQAPFSLFDSNILETAQGEWTLKEKERGNSSWPFR